MGILCEVAGPHYRHRPHAALVRQMGVDHIISTASPGDQEHDFAGIGTGGSDESPNRLAVKSACRDIRRMRVPVAEITEARISTLYLLDETASRSGRQDVMRRSGVGRPYFTRVCHPRTAIDPHADEDAAGLTRMGMDGRSPH